MMRVYSNEIVFRGHPEMPNEHFPLWITANIIIEKVIAKSFGVYVSGNSKFHDCVAVSFLPEESFYLVPEEDREKFMKRYNSFANWASEEIGICQIFNNYIGLVNDQRMQYKLKDEIEQKVYERDAKSGYSLKDCFLCHMGVIYPNVLKDIIKDLD